MFRDHTPSAVKDRSSNLPSPAALFTRGLNMGGTQWKYDFPNGYGASVINDGYGADQGLYEVAVLRDGRLTYETPVTDDVLGYLTEEQVADALDAIAALPEAAR